MLDVKHFSRSLIGVVCVALLSQCGKQGTAPPVDSTEVLVTKGKEIVKHISVQELPLELLTGSSAVYDEMLLLDPALVDDYLPSPEKTALNIGVYTTDGLYLAVYHQTPSYMQRSATCQRMSDEIGIRDGFGAETLQRLDANLGNSDSVISIFKESVRRAQYVLEEDKQEDIATLIATGSLVEFLYILCEIVKPDPATGTSNVGAKDKRATTIEGVVRQKEKVESLARRLSGMSHTELVAWLRDNMITLEQSLTTLEQNEDYTEASFAEIIRQVEKIRGYITR